MTLTSPTPAIRPNAGSWHGAAWTIALVVALFVTGYGLAWNEASTLSARYLTEAESSYARGAYLDAITGYEETIAGNSQRIERGGYAQVLAIWRDPAALPRPAYLAQAEARIDDIIDQHLTIADGERFVLENAGLSNPYFGDVYLRLGELYEEAGDRPTAIEIYRDVISSFRQRQDLVADAQAHLTALGVEP
jgi:tetratricopeptide (TPR) repeat protein